MIEYEYPEHYTDDIFSAIKLAGSLQAAGEYDLFRGQRHNFDIQPSVLRSGVDSEAAQQQLNKFASWVHSTPDLSSLHGDERAILAVAQHYGLKTPFLDFTRSPKIAGFFASDGGKDGDTGTIICLNKKRFSESWADLNQRYYQSEGRLLTELVTIDVNNLWRLHAQEGEFLRCHVDSTLLEMYSFFLHIYFPQSSGTKIIEEKDIYPKEKSHLEVLLDQYFLIDSYAERNRTLEQLFESTFTVSEDNILAEIENFFTAGKLPKDHDSWHSELAAQWMIEPVENYFEYGISKEANLVIPEFSSPDQLESSISKQLSVLVGEGESSKRQSIKWKVTDCSGTELFVTGEGVTTDPNNEFIDFSVSEMVSSIYSGMRYLPYTKSQISRAITRYILMLFFSPYDLIDDCEGVEFSGGKVRGRGFASRRRILNSMRDDFYRFIKPEKLDAHGKMNFRDTFCSASYVRSSYEFGRFLELFVEDLIPTQAAIAVEDLVIGLNPMRIDVFGES